MLEIKLDPQELQDWMENTWNLYASDNINNGMRRLWVNHVPEYKVVYDKTVLYYGTDMSEAIAYWEGV